MYRVLIADDQVPDKDLKSEQEVLEHYTKLYSDANFAAGFGFMYRVVKLLRDQGYAVDCANTPDEAVRRASAETYSVIVLDLGWYTVEKMGYDEKMVHGFLMAEQIRAKSWAPILMYSNRFFDEEDLARTAAEKGCLPVYKSYDEVGAKSLLVSIRWAALRRDSAAMVRDAQLFVSLNMYRRLSNVLLGSIISGVALLLVSIALAAFQKTTETIVASVFGTFTTFANGAIYRYVSAYRKTMTGGRDRSPKFGPRE
jgi:CheY-like chemotaxis protein